MTYIFMKKFLYNIRYGILICLFLTIATLCLYWQVKNFEFINYDDPVYVTENSHIKNGLSIDNIKWAFSAKVAANWHPLTLISHMIDCQLYHLQAGKHHMTSLLFHIINSLLLFLIFFKMTDDLWKSGFIAALFAFHPLHIESVAWVAERKDVLCCFFWMLTIIAYIWYTEKPIFNRYIILIFSFIMGLMSKPMIVTLPFVLLLLDYWPLGRLEFRETKNNKLSYKTSVLNLILEKIPLFLLTAISCIVTFFVQKQKGAIWSSNTYPVNLRIANALTSYLNYIKKMIYPSKLAVLYPYPNNILTWHIIEATIVLSLITLLVIWTCKKHKYLIIGWLWYIGTLIPVIGLVQIGNQSMADRYTYIPYIGLFIMMVWGFEKILPKWRQRSIGLLIASLLIISILISISYKQLGHWKNSITLFKHTLLVTKNNYIAHNNLALALKNQGNINEAINHYYKALSIRPNYAFAHNNLGTALKLQGKISEAIGHYQKALRINPDYPLALNNLGNALKIKGDIDGAIKKFKAALLIDPKNILAHYNLGNALLDQQKLCEAIEHYSIALKIDPNFIEAYINLAVALTMVGNTSLAIDTYYKALYIDPNRAIIHLNLGNALANKGDFKKAILHFKEALNLKPDYTEAIDNLKFLQKKIKDN